MANLRILYNNVADDCSSLVASTTAGALIAANLLTDIKTEVHRSTGTVLSYTLQWAAAQSLSAVILPFCNLTAAATMRSRVYTDPGDVVPALDTTALIACAAAPLVPWAWGTPVGANAFAYGGANCARAYFAATPGKKLVIDISDAGNPAGYIEAARLVTGAYWSPAVNAGYGPALGPKPSSPRKRTEAGNLRAERRPVSKNLKLELSWISSESDRATMYSILSGNGVVRPVFLSLFPADSNAQREQDYQIYGLLNETAMSHPMFGVFSTPLEIEEI